MKFISTRVKFYINRYFIYELLCHKRNVWKTSDTNISNLNIIGHCTRNHIRYTWILKFRSTTQHPNILSMTKNKQFQFNHSVCDELFPFKIWSIYCHKSISDNKCSISQFGTNNNAMNQHLNISFIISQLTEHIRYNKSLIIIQLLYSTKIWNKDSSF